MRHTSIVPGEWTKVKMDVRGTQARLYVHGNDQPTLIVNDVKTAAQGTGAVALWLDTGTVAHFRNLTVISPGTRNGGIGLSDEWLHTSRGADRRNIPLDLHVA